MTTPLLLTVGEAAAPLAGLAERRLLPFAPRTLSFLADFSQRVLNDHSLRASPELIALAYWFRPAAIAALRNHYEALAGQDLLRPRGVVLHFAPANVDTVFVYAWFLSLLCGNRNVLRLSQRESPLRQRLLGLLGELMQCHTEIAASNVLLSYGHDIEITTRLSAACQMRVLWGGNASVEAIRRIALPPLASELVFPDRQSWAMLAAPAVKAADAAALEKLAGAFYNDAFWFAQQACSSPRALVWVGSAEETEAARARFWPALQCEITRRGAHSDASELAARLLAAACATARGARLASAAPEHWPLRLACEAFTEEARAQHCGYGLFYELTRSTLAECSTLFVAADQSLAHFGFARERLHEWAQTLADRALDRLVPIGEALQFSASWDGHDLLAAFSRRVVVRGS